MFFSTLFTDPSMTVAAIDRVVHHSVIIEIQAESYRKRQAISSNANIGNFSMNLVLII